jgi:hypothetical protein
MYETLAATALAANAKEALAHTLTNEALVAFLFGGKAIFTLFNEQTLTRYTYLVEKKGFVFQDATTGRDVKGTRYWVNLLTGPHNTKDYTYLGCLKNETERTFTLSPKSRVGDADLPSVQAISWLLKRIEDYEKGQREDVTGGPLKFYHAGRCGRCGAALTVPESIENGLGPECTKYVGKGIEKKVRHKQLS